MSNFSKQNGQNNIRLLPLNSWQQQLPQGKVNCEGVLLRLYCKLDNAGASAALSAKLIELLIQLLPADSIILEGSPLLTIWLPRTTSQQTQAIFTSVQAAIMNWQSTEYPEDTRQLKLTSNFVELAAQDSAAIALAKLLLPATSAESVTDNPQLSPAENMSARALTASLSAVAHFSRETICQQIINHLQLPAITPRMVIITGPELCGKSRLSLAISRLLAIHHYPTAQLCCRLEEQTIACSLLGAMVYQLCCQLPSHILQGILAGLPQNAGWLKEFIAPPAGMPAATTLPADLEDVRSGFINILIKIAKLATPIVLIENLTYADEESLAGLALIQQETGHALRIIATTASQPVNIKEKLLALYGNFALVVNVAPLESDKVAELLPLIFPIIPAEQRADMLEIISKSTGCLPLAIEALLRHWHKQRILSLQQENWNVQQPAINKPQQLLSPQDKFRLVQIAFMAPVSEVYLSQLWQTSFADSRLTLNNARSLGYLAEVNDENPDMVRFADTEYQLYFAHLLSPEETADAARKIINSFDNHSGDDSTDTIVKRAALLTRAADKAAAGICQQQLRLTLPAVTPLICWPQISEQEKASNWHNPLAQSANNDDIERIILTAQGLRISALQFRLYPATSDMVRSAVKESLAMLEQYFQFRPAFLVNYDGKNIALEGKNLQRREVQRINQDLANWMTEADINAFLFLPGLREDELSRFLSALATAEQYTVGTDSPTRIILLNLTHIKVIINHLLPDAPLSAQQTSYVLAMSSTITAGIAATTSSPNNLPPDDVDNKNYSPVALPTMVNQLAEPAMMQVHDWQKLTDEWAQLPVEERQRVLYLITEWQRSNDGQQFDTDTAVHIDNFISNVIADESDLLTLQNFTALLEEQLKQHMQALEWKKLHQLLQAVSKYITDENDPVTKSHLTGVLRRIAVTMKDNSLLLELLADPAAVNEVIPLLEIIGDSPLQALIEALKNSPAMEERNRLMQLLREFGNLLQPLLLRELSKQNLWYVQRNLLQVLADVGDARALPIASEMLNNQDARVRVEALALVARINIGGDATPLITRGLADSDLVVRTKAANIIYCAPEVEILNKVITMLSSRRGKNSEESFQMALCSSLTAFDEAAARDTLIQLLFPGIFSPYHGKGIAIRAVAASSLGKFLPDPLAEKALQKASISRQQPLRQAAQRALQLFRERNR